MMHMQKEKRKEKKRKEKKRKERRKEQKRCLQRMEEGFDCKNRQLHLPSIDAVALYSEGKDHI